MIEDICDVICGTSLVKLGIPAPNCGRNDAFDREFKHEREYNGHELNQSVHQKGIYNTLMKVIDAGNSNFFTLDTPGMLRNLNQSKLSNGTRLVVKRLMINVNHGTKLKDKFKFESSHSENSNDSSRYAV